MTGNISKKIELIPGVQVPRIKFRYDASTGNLYCESDGIFTSDDYVGMRVESTEKLDELVEQGLVNVGVIYTVKDRVDTGRYFVTGKVSDLFETMNVGDMYPGGTGIACYSAKFTVPDVFVSDNILRLYKETGELIGRVSYRSEPLEASWQYISDFGAKSTDDTISFYVAKNIEFEDIERAMYHNGEAWVEIVTAKHLGDINKALDDILKLDEDLLGGDA